MKDEDDNRGMTKDEIIPRAQPYCPESSFTVPSETSKFHTAWSNMKTLDKHGLVFMRGRPTRYFLSEEGWELAERLKNVAAGRTDALLESPNKRRKRLEREREAENEANQIRSPHTNHGGLDFALNALSECAPDPTTRVAASTTSACPTPRARSRLRAPPSIDLIEIDDDADQQTLFSSQASQATSNFIPISSYERSRPQHPPRQPPASRLPSSNDSISLPNLAPFTPTVLPAGSYTIHLTIDNREVRSKEDRTYIPTQITSLGITPIQRSLSLGDAFWTAKPKTTPSNPHSSEEYILPHIVERKRLDDLVASIKDKRFHDQKFRLQRCGIPTQSITYLIEEYSMSDQQKLAEADRIATAKAETQIVNGFFVKCTHKLDETIRYLARTTKFLQQYYANKPLYIIPQSHIHGPTYSSLCSSLQAKYPDKTFSIPFTTFSDLTSKSGALNLRDLYLKMLMCTRGISGEKAMEIQRVWKTPRCLVEAFEGREGEREREKMVMDGVKGAVLRKRVGAALSKKVAGVWGAVVAP
jgi:crossover junction endonuclease MUS81